MADSEGTGELAEGLFKSCWFQLADINTNAIDAKEYAEWVRLVLSKMVRTRIGANGGDDL